MDESQRRLMMDPEAVLAEIGLGAGQSFVDVGCGDGFFALPAARIVGPAGKAFGVDIDSEQIDGLRKKAAEEGLTNLELRVGKGEESVLCRGCADVVFFGNVLHDFEDPAKVLANALQMLKAGGNLVDFDWKKVETAFGPPLSIRLDEGAAGRLIEEAGFHVVSVRDSGAHHYLMIARPA